MRRQLSWGAVIVVLAAGLGAGAAAAQTCPGDCNADLSVTIDEVVLVSRAFFGTSATAECAAADADGDGVVDAADVQAALAAYADGCGASRAAPIGAAAGTAHALVTLDTVTAAPGTTTSFGATLSTMGNPVVALQQDIAFSPLTRITGCVVNPAINRAQTAFGFQPPGCDPGSGCTAVRAIVISFSDLSPIADGALLFTCMVEVLGGAADGPYPLGSSNTLASDAVGNALPLDGVDGAIIVAQLPTPTPTAAPAPASLILERVRLRADTSRPSDRHNGSILAIAVVDANPPFAELLEDITAAGVSFDVAGAGGMAETLPFAAADCTSRSTVRGPRISCVGDDQNGPRRLDLRPLRPPNLFHLKVTARARGFSPPLTTAPVTAALRTSSFLRADVIGGCAVSRGSRVSTCREVGVVPTATPTPPPTDTPPPTPTPTETATPPEDGTRLIVSDALGVAGGTASFTVLLETSEAIAGTENEIALDGAAPLAFGSCTVNPSIDKSLPHAFRPSGCTPGLDCSGVKAIVINLGDLEPIPSGSVLYACEIAVGAGTAPGDYLIDCFLPGAATPSGGAVATDCVDGTLTVTSP